MLKKTITFVNLDGATITKDLYFNIAADELIEKEALSDSTYSQKLQAIAASNKLSEVYPVIMQFLEDGYGVRTEDGDFYKAPDGADWKKFKNGLAYNSLMEELLLDPNNNGTRMADFINGMLPEALINRAKEQQATPGFRPGADTTRPTPPVAGGFPINLREVPSEQVAEPISTPPQPVPAAPAEAPVQETPTIAHTSEPRDPSLPGQ